MNGLNKDDIIRIAREVGAVLVYDAEVGLFGDEKVIRFAELIIEECAKLCLETEPFYGVMFAEHLRARGQS